MDRLICVAEATLLNYCNALGIDIRDLTDERVKCFLQKWVEKREKSRRPLHPSMLKKLSYATTVVIDRVFRPIPISMKNEIKNTVQTVGAKIFSKRLILIKKANPYTIRTVLPIINSLWNEGKLLSMQAAVVLAVDYATGARTGETLRLQWEDIRRKSNALGNFFQCFVRAGKCNKIPTKNEQVTALVGKQTLINLNYWLEKWRPHAPSIEKGTLGL